MVLKVFVLCCLWNLVVSELTSEFNGHCREFKAPSKYPVVWRNESVVDLLHDVEIADPYRWLENPFSSETKQFVSVQNKLSNSYLKNCRAWYKIHNKLTETYDFKKYTLPQYHGDHYYFQMNTGLQHQSVVYRKKSLDSEPIVFLDPNQIAFDGTAATTSFVFSSDGKKVAYTFNEAGADWNKLRIRDAQTGKDYPETLVGLKFTTTAWTSDSKGFFYNRYLKVGDGTEIELLEYQKVFYHRVGESQDKDVLVFEFLERPIITMTTIVAGNYLILVVLPTGNINQHHLYFANLEKHGEINGKIPLTPVYTKDLNCEFTFLTISGSKAAFRTNKDAPNYRIVWIDLENPSVENWTTLIKEDSYDNLLSATSLGRNHVLAVYLHDVKTVLKIFSVDTGRLIRKIPLGMGSIGGLSLDKTGSELFFQKVSFLSPGIIYQYNFTDTAAEPIKLYEMKPDSKRFKEEDFAVEQVFYRSRDGTKIPMFIVQKKTTKRKPGTKPTLLWGYGGFNYPTIPRFFLDWFFMVNSFDGVLAAANIRGGGEYGTRWHRNGILLHEQDSFDDFHAAAEYLISNKYTERSKLAIRGVSNGGLLVGACINQRPDLYGAAIPQVGVHDMIRYPLHTFPVVTIPEFGDPKIRSDFENLLKYSPLHNIQTPNSTQTQYPATLITTADHDDRVNPLHSYKLAAALQHAVQGNKYQKNPILMRLWKDVGHFGWMPTYKLISTEADVLTFLYRALSIDIDL